MEIVFVRHTSVDVAPGTCYGQSDVAVRDTFEREAAITKTQLEPLMPFDAVYTSPLTRARMLAEFCCPLSHIIADPRLKEMNMGDWEMQRYDDITDMYLDDWYRDYMHLPTPHGESFPQLYQRVAAFIDELRTKPYRRVAAFAHGGVLVCAGLYAGLFAEEGAWDHLVPYGGIERIQV